MATQLPVEIWPAEVKEVIYLDDNPNLIYGIKISRLDGSGADDDTSSTLQTAIPLNYNILRLPIVGEVVLILRAPSSYTTGIRNTEALYYLDVVSLQGSIHHNALPTISNKNLVSTSDNNKSGNYEDSSTGNAKQTRNPKIDSNFIENPTAKPLQHYVGDVIIEGRYGHSLRFTTTPKTGNFAVSPKFSSSEGNPITILRNSRQGIDTKKINDFQTETFTNEDNVLVLASGQNLEFDQSSKVLSSINSKKITSWKDENWGTTPQVLLSSGRIVFNSTQQEIIAFAKKGIGLSSDTSIAIDAKEDISLNSNKIELGTDADEPLILGNKFKTWAENLIDTLATLTVITPTGPSSPLSASPQWASISSIKSRIPTILSDLSFTKKTASVSGGSSKFKELPEPSFNLSETQITERKEQQSALQEEHQDPEKTPAEKDAIADKHNSIELELVNTQASQFVIESDTITKEDLEPNSNEITQVIYSGEVRDANGLKTPKEDYIDGTKVDVADIETDQFWNESYNWLGDSNKNTDEEVMLIQSVTTQSKQKGLEAAAKALADIGVTDDPIGSNTGPRVDVYLQSIGCRPKMSSWGNGCIATWLKEVGLPIPPTKSSTANGWYEWAKSTNRWCQTPIIGSVAVYGVKDNNGNYNCHHLGLVIQIIDSTRILTVEGNINSAVVQSEVNVTSVLGFILPSAEDLPAPTVSFDEEEDPDKLAPSTDVQDPPVDVENTLRDRIRKVVRATMSNGETKHKCARGTYNHALNWVRAATGKSLYTGMKYSAGGNAKNSGYHLFLSKLGFVKSDLGTITKTELRNYLTTSKNFSIGDIVVYWYLDDSTKNASKYGHTQMYTGGYHDRASSQWTTDNNSNYEKAFVYTLLGSNTSKWRLLHFKSPKIT